MRIQTLSLVAGTRACNAKCPFCIAQLTPTGGLLTKPTPIRVSRLMKTLLFAERKGVDTVLITGKGEPTLFPEQITEYLLYTKDRFPFIELQTNGLTLHDCPLQLWEELSLNTIAISVVSHDHLVNESIFCKLGRQYPCLPDTIAMLHKIGFTVRLSVVMLQKGVHNAETMKEFIDFAKSNEVEQVTFRPVTGIYNPAVETLREWIFKERVRKEELKEIKDYLLDEGRLLLELQHGAKVYDVGGQNVCLTNCLTPPRGEDIRQAIFFPDGHLRYDWQYPGAILM